MRAEQIAQMENLANTPPVFVVGPVRSGSTLLKLMLDSHPQVINPGECDFLFDLVGNHGEFPDTRAYLDWLSTNRIFQAKKLTVDPNLTYLELMNSFLCQFKRRGSLLTMNVHRHFDRIPGVFPDARYVRLLRDPRDVARSCISMGWVGHVYYGVDIWSEAEKSWDLLRSRISATQYLEIRYEDLVSDVEAGLRKICDFLGLEHSNQMTAYASHSTYSAPDKDLIYQWKRKYTERELRLVEGKVGTRIVDLGYELSVHEPAKPGLLEKIRLYLLNKRRRVSHQVKRYGMFLYFESLLASRMGSRAWRHACQHKKNKIDIEYLK